MKIAERYLEGLKRAYYEVGGKEEWDRFERVVHGATEGDLSELVARYPDAPEALLELLKRVDGTYWREYAGEEVAFYLLGSDLSEYPYYLLSAEEMCESDLQWLEDYINREYEEVDIDERITDKAEDLHWLHFSDCMNNGGTSKLFLDFSPSAKGKKGQVVRFLHDPDQIAVIAESFEEYLTRLAEQGYDFIEEDEDC